MTKKFTLSTLIAGTVIGTVSYLLIKPREVFKKLTKSNPDKPTEDADKNDDFIFI